MIKVLIVDQHPIFAEGLRLIIKNLKDIDCVGTARNGAEAVKLAGEVGPDIVITEVVPPCMDSLEFIKQIKTDRPGTRVILLTQFYDHHCIKVSISAGVDGFVLKNTDQEGLIDAIRMVHAGRGVFDLEVVKGMFSILNGRPDKPEEKPERLSRRETEVLSCIALGMSNRAIARELNIRPNTVAVHLGKIYKTLGVDSRTAAAAYAIAMDLVSIDKDNFAGVSNKQ
jgi:DNA-binding NarL/FixJ family response regulator